MEKLIGKNRVEVKGAKNFKASYFKPSESGKPWTLFIFKGTEGGMYEFQKQREMLGYILRKDTPDFAPSKTAKALRAQYQAEIKGVKPPTNIVG